MTSVSRDDTASRAHRHWDWERTRFIYGLYDPDGGPLRYVGCCLDTERRLKSHLNGTKSVNARVKAWLAGLIAVAKVPVLLVLQECKGLHAAEHAERRWIAAWSLVDGKNLLNVRHRSDFLHLSSFVSTAKRFAREQARRKRAAESTPRPKPVDKRVMVSFRRRRQCLAAWAKELGISRQALDQRAKKMGPEKAVAFFAMKQDSQVAAVAAPG